LLLLLACVTATRSASPAFPPADHSSLLSHEDFNWPQMWNRGGASVESPSGYFKLNHN
jgi:hypothetical protein